MSKEREKHFFVCDHETAQKSEEKKCLGTLTKKIFAMPGTLP